MAREGRANLRGAGTPSGRLVRQEASSGEAAQSEQDHRDDRQVHPGVDAQVRGEHAHASRGEAADAPHAVQPGDDGAAEAAFQHQRLGVHDHVTGARGHAEHQEDPGQPHRRGRQGGQRETGAPEGEQEPRGGAPAETVGHAGGHGHGHEGAHRLTQQDQSEHGGGEVEVPLQPGDAGRQAARDRSVEGEDKCDGAMVRHALEINRQAS
ncbi:hypothetical protein GCM10020219_042420 [Nonomuraea dietziae]